MIKAGRLTDYAVEYSTLFCFLLYNLCYLFVHQAWGMCNVIKSRERGGGGRGTPIYGLYKYVPRDRDGF